MAFWTPSFYLRSASPSLKPYSVCVRVCSRGGCERKKLCSWTTAIPRRTSLRRRRRRRRRQRHRATVRRKRRRRSSPHLGRRRRRRSKRSRSTCRASCRNTMRLRSRSTRCQPTSLTAVPVRVSRTRERRAGATAIPSARAVGPFSPPCFHRRRMSLAAAAAAVAQAQAQGGCRRRPLRPSITGRSRCTVQRRLQADAAATATRRPHASSRPQASPCFRRCCGCCRAAAAADAAKRGRGGVLLARAETAHRHV